MKLVLKETRVVIPDVVESELRDGTAQHQHLAAVLEADWIEVVPLETSEQLAAFAHSTSANAAFWLWRKRRPTLSQSSTTG